MRCTKAHATLTKRHVLRDVAEMSMKLGLFPARLRRGEPSVVDDIGSKSLHLERGAGPYVVR
jgi:hypothetical protein